MLVRERITCCIKLGFVRDQVREAVAQCHTCEDRSCPIHIDATVEGQMQCICCQGDRSDYKLDECIEPSEATEDDTTLYVFGSLLLLGKGISETRVSDIPPRR